MASSRKPRSAERGSRLAERVSGFLDSFDLKGRRVAVGLSGGVDSVVLLHLLDACKDGYGFSLRAFHVHHGLSAHADRWTQFCRRHCGSLGIPFQSSRVRVAKARAGLEAAARAARYAAFRRLDCDFLALAHHLDDQAETVLMNLLRGAGVRGASGMPERAQLGDKVLLRPLLSVSRKEIQRFAVDEQLEWVEDESNADEALTRNFIRLRVGPLLATRFPRWKESLARAARHFAAEELDARALLREYLRSRGLEAPSEARLVEMLKQLTSGGARTALRHDGTVLRVYRGSVLLDTPQAVAFSTLEWNGEPRLRIPQLGGELRFRRARGEGIAVDSSKESRYSIRLRSGGERLQPDPKRPRRTLKNLFQEAGVPPWRRERLPLLFCGEDLVWAPGLGVDARYQARAGRAGIVPEWRA